MSLKQSYYERLLSILSSRTGAIALLREYRPYLEMLPSVRRPQESIIAIPLPVARLSYSTPNTETRILPCDVALLMCDPEWKVKMGVEILLFIHRPGETYSQLLGRWRQTQVLLDSDYEWLMPESEKHMFSETAEQIHPLFVLSADTPELIIQGLEHADLPLVIESPLTEEETLVNQFS